MPEMRPKQFQILFRKGSVDLAVVEHLINLNAADIDREVLLFHLQQAAEKFLKALLSNGAIHFEKTRIRLGTRERLR
jgi:HEPN domain-containing protein